MSILKHKCIKVKHVSVSCFYSSIDTYKNAGHAVEICCVVQKKARIWNTLLKCAVSN